jgi:hypothetical protein
MAILTNQMYGPGYRDLHDQQFPNPYVPPILSTQQTAKVPIGSYTDPQTGTIHFNNPQMLGPQQGTAGSPMWDANGDLADPRLQQQFQDNFNPEQYTPSTPGATPGIAPPALISAEENAEIDAQIASQQGVAQQPPQTQEAPPTNGKEPWQMSFAEKMGRYGGNIMNAKGGMAQVGAMGSTSAEIYEAERAQNQQIEQNEIARMAKLKTSTAALESLEQMRAMDNTKSKFDSALAGFIKYGDTVTGPLDSRYQAFKDSSGLPLPGGAPADPERAAFVLSLKDIIVNDTLLKTAMTKGAISNAEMALFQQGIPNMNQQEAVWIAWLTARRQNIEMIQNRIRNGTQVSLDSGVGFANAYTAPGSGSSSPASSAPSALTQAQLDAMAKNTPK